MTTCLSLFGWALNHNPSLRLLVVDPQLVGWGEVQSESADVLSYRQRLTQLVTFETRDPRVTLVNAVFGGDTRPWPGAGDYTFADVLPEIGGKSSREIAEHRLQAIDKLVHGGAAP